MKTHGSCLYCFHQVLDEHSRCAECGRSSLPSQRAEFWNQHPRLIENERAWKVGVAVLGTVGTLMFFLLSAPNSGPAAGWLVLFPAGLAVGGWNTAGKWTRHLPYFDARVVWCSALCLTGLAFGLIVVLSNGGNGASFAWGAVFVASGAALAFVAHQICASCEAWKHDLMSGVRRLEE